jgi:septum formation protein
MSQIHLPIEVQHPQTDEKPKKGEKPSALVSRLSREKAASVREIAIQKYDTSLIIAADTIVVAPNGRKILGKPTDPTEAVQMLKMLSGKTHTVLTGYCLWMATRKKPDKKIVRVVQSKVKMRSLSKREIERYVESKEPMDKAGAYAAQGLGMALIERINGSYTNVVGLPMTQILIDLEKAFKIELFSWMK